MNPLFTIGLSILLAATGTAAVAENGSAQLSIEGLERVEKDARGEIYAHPEVDWSEYSRILLEPASIAFRKNWQRDQNRHLRAQRVRAGDMQRIRADVADMFGEVMREELTAHGYDMASESGADVLQIKPYVVDLDIYAPDIKAPGDTRSYTRQVGRMTLKLEVYDSVTGELLARASDRREAPYHSYLQWTTRITNNFELRRMMERWAQGLRTRLDEARQTKS